MPLAHAGGRAQPAAGRAARRLGLACAAAAALAAAATGQGAFLAGRASNAGGRSSGAVAMRHGPSGDAPRKSHGDVAKAQMPQMPEPPADPLDWSVEKVRKSNFMGSAAYASSLCGALEAGSDGEEYSARLSAMLGHADGVRGFFVTYLTDPSLKSIADAPEGLSPLVVSALKVADPAVVAPLAVMNLVMPTATGMAHAAAGNEDRAAMSRLTASRGSRVLQALASDETVGPATRAKMRAARLAADAGAEGAEKEWTSFYARWKYDDPQMEAICKALDGALAAQKA